MNAVLKTAEVLGQHGIESSRVNAEHMLCAILNCQPADLYTEEITLTPQQGETLNEMIIRRLKGEPLQYIIEKVNFYGLNLFIEKGVFIPRPETEILAEAVLGIINYRLASYANISFILDIGTGTGNIAIALTKASRHCRIVASDISDQALSLAKKNAMTHKVYDRIGFVKADMLDLPRSYLNSFDIIVSNPPYITNRLMERLPAEVRHEPREALSGGNSGLEFYAKIIKKAPYFLKKDGIIAFEVGDGLYRKVEMLLRLSRQFSDIRPHKDLNRIDRVITAKRV